MSGSQKHFGKSLRFCKPWKRCSRSCWHYHLMASKETVFLSNAESRRNCLSGPCKVTERKIPFKIYLSDRLFNTAPSPFSGNTWWVHYHLSHDISPSFLHSKVICVNVFWGAAICCYRATRTFFAPVCSLWSSPWHSLQQLALFPPPRHKSLTFRKCPRSSGQQDNKPEFASVLYFTGRTDNRLTLWISNLVLYTLHTSDLYNNPYRKEAKNRDSSPFIDVLLHLKMAEFIKTNRQKRV